ncbi:MAG: hypothetical protein ACI9TO_000522, partial [Rickettsiales bacterium]
MTEPITKEYSTFTTAHEKVRKGVPLAIDIESTLFPFSIQGDSWFKICDVCERFYNRNSANMASDVETADPYTETLDYVFKHEKEMLSHLAEGYLDTDDLKQKINDLKNNPGEIKKFYKTLPADFLFSRGMRLLLRANKKSGNSKLIIASIATENFAKLTGSAQDKNLVFQNLAECAFNDSTQGSIYFPDNENNNNWSIYSNKTHHQQSDVGYELKDGAMLKEASLLNLTNKHIIRYGTLSEVDNFDGLEIIFCDNDSKYFYQDEKTKFENGVSVIRLPFATHAHAIDKDKLPFVTQPFEGPSDFTLQKIVKEIEQLEQLEQLELEQKRTKNIKTETQYSTADNKIVKILVEIRDKNVFLSEEEKVHNLRDPIYKELEREDVPINSSDRNKMCEPLSQDLIDDMARNRQIDAAEAFLQLFEQIQGNPIVEVSSLSPNPEPNSKENFELKDPMYAMASLVNIAPGDDLKALFGDGLEEKMNAENKVEFVAKKSLQTEKLSAIRTVKYVIPKDLQEFSINTKINQYTENKNFRKTTDTNLETLTINKTEYFPTAFIVHGGDTVGGHYIAYVKCDDNKWYRYNDDGCDGPLDETEVFFIAAKDSAMIKYSTKQAGLPGKQANGINNTGNTCWMNALLAYGLSFKTLGKPITKPSETIAIEKAKEKLFLQLEEFAIAVIGKDPVLTSEENTKLDQAIKESISESENISTSESALLALLKNVFTKIGRAFDAAGNTDANKKIAQEKEEKLTAIKDTFSNIEEDIQNKIIEKIKAELVTVEKINNLKEILKQTDTKDNNTNKINSLKTLLENSLIHGTQNMTDDEFSKRLGLIVFISKKAGKDAGGIEATKENVVLMLKAIGDDSCSIKNLEKQFEVAKEAAKEAAKDLENARKEMRAIAKESGVNFYEPTIQELKKHLGIRRTIDAAKKEISDAIKKENGEKEVVGLNELLKDFEEELITIAEDLEGNDEAQKVKVLKPLLQKKLEALGKRGGAHVILAKLDDRIGSLDLSNGKTQYSTILKVLAGDTEAFKILTPPPSTAEKPRAIWIGDIQIIKDAKDVGLLDENGDQGKGYEIPTSAKLGNKDEVSGVTEAFRKSVNNHKNAIDTEGGEQNFDNPIVYCGLGATFEMSTITIDKDGKVVIPLLDIFEGALGWELGLTKGCVIKMKVDENSNPKKMIQDAITKIRALKVVEVDLFASDGKRH